MKSLRYEKDVVGTFGDVSGPRGFRSKEIRAKFKSVTGRQTGSPRNSRKEKKDHIGRLPLGIRNVQGGREIRINVYKARVDEKHI